VAGGPVASPSEWDNAPANRSAPLRVKNSLLDDSYFSLMMTHYLPGSHIQGFAPYHRLDL
jgi:hypothetical protein